MIYNFITPSDPITFITHDPKVAFICALIMGNGKAGCQGEDGSDIPSLLFLAKAEEVNRIMDEQLGEPGVFIKEHLKEMVECFDSFAYVTIADRQQYDEALAAITDPGRLREFKARHENRQRTSMYTWVSSAWKMAEQFRKQHS